MDSFRFPALTAFVAHSPPISNTAVTAAGKSIEKSGRPRPGMMEERMYHLDRVFIVVWHVFGMRASAFAGGQLGRRI
jgi:hypothetical protein